MKQKAIRLETVGSDVYKRNEHVRLVGGSMDGYQMHITVACEFYHLDLEIDETKLFQIEKGNLRLVSL